MSIHPNTILLLALTPDDLPRKTMREIIGKDYDRESGDDFTIADQSYHVLLMEHGSYDDSFQVSAKQGDLVFFRFLTYGYGETIRFESVQKEAKRLEAWAIETCAKHRCTWRIELTANYW